MIGVVPPAITPPLANADRMFRALARPRLDALGAARARLVGGDAGAALAEIASIAHKIAGTAATLGHDRLGMAADAVERMAALGASGDDIAPALDAMIDALTALADP